MDHPSPKEKLGELFGSYKAEWLKERMFDLFTEPDYFPQLTASRPCLLIGGRGTGKTTVLRCMSYEGQFALRDKDPRCLKDWPFFGLYYRVNTNRVSAFRGPEISVDRWIRVFGHYLNLLLCDLAVRFLVWYEEHCPSCDQISPKQCRRIARSLLVKEVDSVAGLLESITDGLIGVETYVNNVGDNDPIQLSLQGAPIDALLTAISELAQFRGRSFFFLLDEYENFEDYQQQVVNTLIKHCGQPGHPYTFKVGVRELGLRCRSTLNEHEQLISPADYDRIRIAEELEGDRFSTFALSVVNERLASLVADGSIVPDVRSLLPGMSAEEEAAILDGEGQGLAADAAARLMDAVGDHDRARLEAMPLLEKYFVYFWASSHGMECGDAWADYCGNTEAWRTRYENYKYPLLFTLRRGKRGIVKYYAGWSLHAQLAAANIRYVMELVHNSLVMHLDDGGNLAGRVSPKTQTLAAQRVAKKNLWELEGLMVHGAQLTKLLLGLGRVFQILAAKPSGHTPEITQFHVPAENGWSGGEGALRSSDQKDVDELLKAAVMHLALLRFSGSKLTDEADTREYDYMPHPLFSTFFVYSHRRKRKIPLTGEQILGLVRHPKRTIRQILMSQNRHVDEPLPEQLLLFEGFYDADT